MKQIRPLPPKFQLAPTLAQRVRQLREFRNMTVKDLAKLSRFEHSRLEEIESGFENWLSASDRQLLAQALSVEPAILQEVEMRPELGDTLERQAAAQFLARAILEGARDLACPSCGNTLRCSVQEGLDLEGRPIRFAKAFCMKCPFVLR
jgi:transcriptional regulator with XRE-family HTH domain